MPIDEDGGIQTSDESEYSEDGEYITDEEEEDYVNEEGDIEEGGECYNCVTAALMVACGLNG